MRPSKFSCSKHGNMVIFATIGWHNEVAPVARCVAKLGHEGLDVKNALAIGKMDIRRW